MRLGLAKNEKISLSIPPLHSKKKPQEDEQHPDRSGFLGFFFSTLFSLDVTLRSHILPGNAADNPALFPHPIHTPGC